MTAGPIYLDCAATTPLSSEVLEAMLPFLRDDFGNPSSAHGCGRTARAAVDRAREQVATALGCEPREIVFTSGGTEADNLAIRGVVDRALLGGAERPHIVTSAIEHDAVLSTCEQLADLGRATTTIVGCDGGGRVDPEEVAAAVRDDTVLVTVMLANNEVGSIQPVADIAGLVRERNPRTLVHTDAVQALGKLVCDVTDLGVDMLSLSGHKVSGPKGIGALRVRHGALLAAQVSGGGQERRRRSGTENVAGIVGLGLAVERAEADRPASTPRLRRLTDRLRQAVVEAMPDTVLTGSELHRLPNIASFAFPGTVGEVVVTALDGEGICASAGSACSSGAATPSHVLAAMGFPAALAAASVRCSLGTRLTEADVDRAAAAIIAAVIQARAQQLS